MTRTYFLPLVAIVSIMSSCQNNTAQKVNTVEISSSSPFLNESKLPFQTADFAKIHDNDFSPAFDEGIKQQLAEIQKIAYNIETPTFDNTLVAIEKTGSMLARVRSVFDLLTAANTNPVLQKLQEDVPPKLASLNDDIFLNAKLFKREEAVYRQRAQLKLDPESNRLLDFYHLKFMMAGANLSDIDKQSLKKLNQEEATLSAKFTNKLLAAAQAGALMVSDSIELAGMSAGEIAVAKQSAKDAKMDGKWLLKLQNTTQQPPLAELSNRATREKLFNQSWTRAEKSDSNDTRATISRIAEIRAQKAKLLGFPNYSAWALQDQMAKKPEAVEEFLGKLIPAATANAISEAKEIQALIDKQKGGFQLQPWDWNFYSEQVLKAKYDLDEKETKPYFELNNVLENGVFYAANLLYGLTFKERTNLPVYQKDVRVFEVFDKDNTSIALVYFDYFKRDNKLGGAWMNNLVTQSKLLGLKPVIYNVCNFTKPADGQPALISFNDVTTMFHEFGHGLHGIFSSQQYPSLSGAQTARDFVEFPSQFNEHWASDPIVFKHYAIHYQTKQPMPQQLIDKIKKARNFNQGYALTELLAAASLDMKWHTLGANGPKQDVDKFEVAALKSNHVALPQVPTRYRSSYFQHIWTGGYASGYYAYLWSEMLDDDAFAWFQEHGGLTRKNGQYFRDMILSRGNSDDLATLYRNFRGKEPNIQPMLENRGLASGKK